MSPPFFGRTFSRSIASLLTRISNQEQRADPLTGLTSDVYKGPGMVQSPPKGA